MKKNITLVFIDQTDGESECARHTFPPGTWKTTDKTKRFVESVTGKKARFEKYTDDAIVYVLEDAP